MITEFERKSVQAAAMGQQATGAPVSFHPGRDPQSPFEIMRIFTEAGGYAKKAIMSHLESMQTSEFYHELTNYNPKYSRNHSGSWYFGRFCYRIWIFLPIRSVWY